MFTIHWTQLGIDRKQTVATEKEATAIADSVCHYSDDLTATVWNMDYMRACWYVATAK